MRTTDLIKRSGRSLSSAKVRTILTSLAIAVGAFTLTLTLAAGEGIRQYSEKLVSSNFDPRELIIAKDMRVFGADPSGFNKPQEYSENTSDDSFRLKLLTTQDLDTIRATAGVEDVRGAYQFNAQYIVGANDTKYTAQLQNYNAGQRPEMVSSTAPDVLPDGEVLLPESYADALGYSSAEQAVGSMITATFRRAAQIDPAEIQRVLMTEGQAGLEKLQRYETLERTFRIAGVTKPSATSFTAQTALLVSSQAAQEIDDFLNAGTDNYRTYRVVYVRTADEAGLTGVQKDLEQQGYNVQSVEDTQDFLNTIINVLQGVVLVFGVITLIASVFGVINTQYISVLERTREIGLQKALGMRRLDITWLFLIEAAWIGLLGGVLGAAGAWALGTALNPWLTELLGIGAGNSILIFAIVPVLTLIAVLIAIAMVAGLLPALKAARLDPIEALRTE